MFERFKQEKPQAQEKHAGYPEAIGLYEVEHEGERKYMLHKICVMNGKHRWMNPDGTDVIGNVEWIDGPIKADQMKPKGDIEDEGPAESEEIDAEDVELMLDEGDYIHAEKIDESER